MKEDILEVLEPGKLYTERQENGERDLGINAAVKHTIRDPFNYN